AHKSKTRKPSPMFRPCEARGSAACGTAGILWFLSCLSFVQQLSLQWSDKDNKRFAKQMEPNGDKRRKKETRRSHSYSRRMARVAKAHRCYMSTKNKKIKTSCIPSVLVL
ncbi:MAG: hypothetical protein RR937_07390, partial [Ruthenibacterium sp.]